MALVNHAKREINAKIVYYGPGLSGKATNLNYVFRKLKPEHRGKLKLMNVQKDKMLFFDFMPVGQGNMNGYNVRYHIYTIIGENVQSSSWKMVLKGVDGVVFVADSSPDRMAVNLQSMSHLHEFLAGYGKTVQDIPLIVQCNKQDTAAAASLEKIADALSADRISCIPATAGKGEGVLETLFSLLKMIRKDLRENNLSLEKRELVDEAEAEARSDQHKIDSAQVSYFTAEPKIASVTPESSDIQEPSFSPPSSGVGDHTPEPSIEFIGNPQLHSGCLSLPLMIKYGGLENKITINFSISVERE